MSTGTSADLNREIDSLAEQATGQLRSIDRGIAARRLLGRSLLWLAVIPSMLVLLQAIRWLAGMPAGTWFSWPVAIVGTLGIPAVWLAWQIVRSVADVNRLQALGAIDASMNSKERVVTADQFLQTREQNGFVQAAIEDAQSWVERGRLARLESTTTGGVDLKLNWAAIPLAMCFLALAFYLSGFARATTAADEKQTEAPSGDTPVQLAAVPNENQPDEEVAEPEPRNEDKRSGGRRDANRSGAAATETPEGEEESAGKLTDGETQESQQATNPSAAQGAPSSQGQPSKSETQNEKKPNRQKPRKNDRERAEKENEEKEEPSGATAGQGASRGSNNSAAASDWASRNQVSTPDDDQSDEDEDVDDDDEEQKSRGGVQPNMRDRRTPVNRDLNVGFGMARPNPDANGRGGPGAQKKSRGVASLVLGVPIPDRITGQPNKGRTRITQQRITPEAEDTDQVQAQNRGTRTGSSGPVARPEMAPWLQDVIRKYFLQRRQAAARGDSEVAEPAETTDNREGNQSKS